MAVRDGADKLQPRRARGHGGICRAQSFLAARSALALL